MDRFWNASRGFGLALAIILIAFAMNESFKTAYQISEVFKGWIQKNSFLAEFLFYTLRGCVWVVVAYCFSGIQPLRKSFHNFGLAARISSLAFLAALGAIFLGLLNLYFVQSGITQGNPSATPFYYGGQGVWLMFIAQSILLSPFFEEVTLRGFMYRAFRGSFGFLPSFLLVTGIQIYFHWGLVSNDLIALIFLVSFCIIICLIREHTGSTWNCFLFHAFYNATVLRQWGICLGGLVVLAVLWDYRKPLNNSPSVSSFALPPFNGKDKS